VVCTKHLLRLELGMTTRCRHQRGAWQRLRGLETQLSPTAGRLKTTGSGRRPVPVSTQLGRGAAHSWSSQRRVIQACRASTGVQSTHRTPGLRAQMLAGPHDDLEHRFGLGPIVGPARRQAPVLLERVQSLGLALIAPLARAPPAPGGRAAPVVDGRERSARRDGGRVKVADPSRSWPVGPERDAS